MLLNHLPQNSSSPSLFTCTFLSPIFFYCIFLFFTPPHLSLFLSPSFPSLLIAVSSHMLYHHLPLPSPSTLSLLQCITSRHINISSPLRSNILPFLFAFYHLPSSSCFSLFTWTFPAFIFHTIFQFAFPLNVPRIQHTPVILQFLL